ncbi:hypothetical protein HDU96_007821 [Phlyctochytrium bullatum]|nr:hypothetical protein HDU96_007821 [Phlyctochytrium bullatum]
MQSFQAKITLPTAKGHSIVGIFQASAGGYSAVGDGSAGNAISGTPNTSETGKAILPTLEQIPDGKGQRIIILCHGMLAHKNSLFFPHLAESLLPISTFRFDFGGTGESSGDPHPTYWDNAVDLEEVVDQFVLRNWRIHAIIGHSRGGNVVILYALKHPRVPRFIVNISARFEIDEGLRTRFKDQLEVIKEKGYFEIEVRKRTGVEKVKSYVKLADWEQLDKEVRQVQGLPRNLSFLTCHGLSDTVVPPTDAAHFASRIPTHTLQLIRGADHNFSAQPDREALALAVRTWLEDEETRMDRFWRTYGGPERSIRVPGVKNFRDVGGYPVFRTEGFAAGVKGLAVKKGLLYRSASLGKATEAGFHTLKSLGIKKIFDTRSNVEITNDASVERLKAFDMGRVHCPVFSQEDFSPLAIGIRWKLYTEGSEGFSKAYTQILRAGGPSFRTILEGIAGTAPSNPSTDSDVKDASTSGLPAVVHCTAGKDRTGMFIALMLSFLGVEDDIIVRDYALTETLISYSEAEITKFAEYTQGRMDNNAIRRMLGSSPDSMRKALALLRDEYGSARAYFLNHVGVSEETLRLIEEQLIDVPATCDPARTVDGGGDEAGEAAWIAHGVGCAVKEEDIMRALL